MDPDPASSSYQLLSIGALIIINGMFVASEYALISCDPNRIRSTNIKDSSERDRNEKKYQSTIWLIDHSELCVASIQLGITACSLLIGFLGIDFFYSYFISISETLTSSSSQLLLPFIASFVAALMLLVFIHVIFGELFVKAIGTAFPEATLRVLGSPIKLFTQLTYPLSAIVYTLANLFLKPFQLTIGHSDDAVLSLAELKRLFSSVPSTSEIGTEQARMIRGVVGFSETIAREVMTPRTDLFTIKVDATLDEVVEIILETGFSRFPVRGERVDDVLGVILARDVMPFVVMRCKNENAEFDVKKIMRQPYYIPGTKPVDELLNEFRKRKIHLAIILDEHGGVDGIVTLEDLIEEIVGDIYDENDEPEREYVRDPNGDLIVDGGVLVADLNEKFNLEIPEGQYDTVAGFIFTYLGRIPKRSDTIFVHESTKVYVNGNLEKSANGGSGRDHSSEPELVDSESAGIRVSVEKVEGHRIESVRFCFVEPKSLDTDQSAESESENEASQFKSAITS